MHIVQRRGTAIIDSVDLPGSHQLKLVHRGIRDLNVSDYWEMIGKLGALDWSGYDNDAVEVAYLDALAAGGETIGNARNSKYLVGMERLVSALCELDG